MASAAPASCQFSVLQSSFPSLPKFSSVKNSITCRSGLQYTRECKQCCLAAKGCTPNSWGACLRSHTEMSRSTATVSLSRKVAALPDNGGSDSRSLSTSSNESGVPGMQLSLLRWKRVLLKVSGEALLGDGAQNIDPKVTMSIANEVAAITRLGVQVGIVVGGGNFFRGANWVGSSGLDRGSADHIGMMATVMNAIFLQASLESVGIPTRVQTAFRMAEVAEPYIRRRAIRHLEKGRVVIFGAGTGNPFFTTDTAAALRAAEIDAEVVLKATNVDGVYDSDPKTNKAARLLHHVSYSDVAVKRLSVMDITAITLCQENHIPVVVFNLSKEGNIAKAISGERIGTLIDDMGY